MNIKFCGITKQEDYKYITENGADYTGFIFFKKSPRNIEPEDAAKISVEGSTNKRVGVFVNESKENIQNIAKIAKLDIIQLHGDETPEFCDSLGLEYWKVFRVKDLETIAKFKEYSCDTILIDTYSKVDYGGTGKVIDLELTKAAILEVTKLGKKLILAGGISPENVSALKELDIFAVDVNSGVEIEPGVKNLDKVKQVLHSIKQ